MQSFLLKPVGSFLAISGLDVFMGFLGSGESSAYLTEQNDPSKSPEIMRILLVLALFITACSTGSDPEQDEADIRALIEQVATANIEGDVESWVGAFDDPFWYMPAYQTAVTNRDSLIAMTRTAFESWDVDVTIEPQDITIEGNWAHVYSEVRARAEAKDGSDSADVNVKQLVVYHRTENGWKISKLMISPNLWEM